MWFFCIKRWLVKNIIPSRVILYQKLEESSTMADVPPDEPTRRLDAIDRKILRVLQEDATLSVAEIGDRVGLSSTPCWKRIQRMEIDGVITGTVALVDQNKIGINFPTFATFIAYLLL